MQFVDVWERKEIPPPPAGHRYLDFLGGERQIRCYLVPEDMPRSQFFNEHDSLLDASLAAVYDHNGITVRQDSSYALPGFYIVALREHYRALDEMTEEHHLRLFLVLRETRAGMRKALGMDHVNVYYEEKPGRSASVHYWLVPAHRHTRVPADVIMRINLRDYLQQFQFAEERDAIIDCNRRMREYFSQVRLEERDDGFVALLHGGPPG